jgi:ubiquinone biosynthesis protein COQ9
VNSTSNDAIKEAILLATLAHIPFDGWGDAALIRGAADAGHDPAIARRLFPGGATEMIALHSRYADRRMLEELAGLDLDAMKIRDRITLAVRVRLQQNALHREAVRRAMARLALPHNAMLATRLLYRTVDAMWHAAGDTATDHNFYTKRALLAGVYASTVMCWLNDGSPDLEVTWAFLDRRIAEVMRVPKAMAGIGRMLGNLPNPLRLLRFPGAPT